MVDDFIEPVDNVKPSRPIVGGQTRRPQVPEHHRSIAGLVIAVHRRSGRPDGEHVLDTSVGGHEYTEVVVRLDSDLTEDLVGKRVAVSFRP